LAKVVRVGFQGKFLSYSFRWPPLQKDATRPRVIERIADISYLIGRVELITPCYPKLADCDSAPRVQLVPEIEEPKPHPVCGVESRTRRVQHDVVVGLAGDGIVDRPVDADELAVDPPANPGRVGPKRTLLGHSSELPARHVRSDELKKMERVAVEYGIAGSVRVFQCPARTPVVEVVPPVRCEHPHLDLG